ncbi:MAG: hypothetical protein WC058_14185 [Phycisphaeraceae bacterium]
MKTREKAATSQATVRSLSVHGYRSAKVGLKTFQQFVGNRVWSDDQTNEKLLADYRTYLESKVQDGSYKPNTFNDKLKFLKLHVKWLYRQRLIPELPRNLQEVGVKARTIKQGHPLTLEQVQQLWAVAAPRERCWMVLGLNCGYYSKDISDLIPKDMTVAPGYVARMRQKKDVPSKHLLWAVTCNLIEECRFKGQDAATKSLFLSKNHTVLNEAGRDLVGIFFKKLVDRAKIKAVFSQFRDTGAEFVENYARQHTPYDPSLTQLYLAHRDNRTAQYYLSNDPAVMQVPALDQALAAMEKHFNLEHNPKDAAQPVEQDATK